MAKLTTPFTPEQLEQLTALVKNHSSEQIAWLSGYLWGLTHESTVKVNNQEKSITAPKSEGSSQTITILSASQSGNARGVAKQLVEELEQQGFNVTHYAAGDYKSKKIAEEHYLIVVCSTQGDGEPPEEALGLFEYLKSKKAPKLSQLTYAVFALGDSSYPQFCQAGKDLEERLQALGAKPLLERVDADTDYQEVSEQWRHAVTEKLMNLLQLEAATESLITTIAKPATEVLTNLNYSREHPFSAPVMTNQLLSGRGSPQRIYHIELDLQGSGIRYQPGDALGVWYQNSTDLVNEMLNYLEISADVVVNLNGQNMSLRTALTEHRELTINTPTIVERYLKTTRQGELQAALKEPEQLHQFSRQTPLVDMFRRYPARLAAQDLVQLLRPLAPRLYSIASSQDEVGEEAHITVSLAHYSIDGYQRFGGASSFLTTRHTDGDAVKIFITQNNHFRLPEDNSKPVIMIGAGTGVAPYRAFMQQRAAEKAPGKNWLIFGNPHFTTDFLYQLEWQDYVKSSILTHIDLAWSRDQAEKVYVQHKLLERAEDIWQWLEQGAYLYVCGDAEHMAKAVDQTLLTLIQQQGKLNAEQAANYISELRQHQRYQRDIY